ncbi:MAG: hypothetical protein KGM24_11890 [Elusimicrobia bacterium]|nr:hypothetical protein [Elusimicrobiota bacterium]
MGEPAYYEVWGGLESANRALWIALWFAVTVALLALALVRVELRRPPVVIALGEDGRSSVMDSAQAQPAVGEVEVRNFLALFERFYVELNAYTCDSDLKLAFAMMTPDFQAKAARMLKSAGTIEKLKTEELQTNLFLSELRIVRDTPDILECRVKGYRRITSFKPGVPPGEVVFEHDIVLRKVPRSERAPYGLLVQDFKESVFKQTGTAE